MLSCSSWRTLGSGLSVIAFLLNPVVASAEPFTLFTDREAFLAAVNPDRLLTFDEPTFGILELLTGDTPLGPTTFPQVRYDFGDVQILTFVPSEAPNPIDDVVPAIFTGMTFRLPAHTYAVGLDLVQAARTTFHISFAGALELTPDVIEWNQLYVPPDCPFGTGTPPCEPFIGFIGAISADDNVSIRSVSVQGSPPGFLSSPISVSPYPAVVDNLVWQVPEPATALLLGAGLVGVYWRGRRVKHARPV